MKTDKKIIINNLLLNYYLFLPAKKPDKTLIFLHGWGVDSRLWFKIIHEIKKEGYSSFLIDLPGFGQSQDPDSVYDVDDYKNIVNQFIKKLSLKNVNLVGHSFGGRVAIKMASENPDFLDKIILVDAAGIVHDSRKKKLLTVISKIIGPIFRPSFMLPLRKKFYGSIGSEYLENIKLSKIFSKVVSEDLTRLFPKIKKPLLIIWGANDDVTPVADGQIINGLIPKSKFVILEKAGHFCFLDQPEAFTKALLNFL